MTIDIRQVTVIHFYTYHMYKKYNIHKIINLEWQISCHVYAWKRVETHVPSWFSIENKLTDVCIRPIIVSVVRRRVEKNGI